MDEKFPRSGPRVPATVIRFACGRPLAGDGWTAEKMPLPRVMGDAVVLPNGKVVVLNGAMVSARLMARGPVSAPVRQGPSLLPSTGPPGNASANVLT